MKINKVTKVTVVVKVEEDTTSPTIEMKMITKILLEEEVILQDLKISHINSVHI